LEIKEGYTTMHGQPIIKILQQIMTFFHIRTVHLDIIKVLFIHQLMC